MGAALDFLDKGGTAVDLTAQALTAAFGADATNTQIVEQVYVNIVGKEPTAYALSHYAGLLDRGIFTPAQLVQIASDNALNLTQIDIVGLAHTGLEYHLSG